MSKIAIGIDTSNYTTSLSLIKDGVIIKNTRRLLPVAENERGLRQSDALFCHTKALPELAKELFSESEYSKEDLCCVGVSTTPRPVCGSYMPCFLAGVSFASAVSESLGVPMYSFSHQEGHIMAALHSCGNDDVGKGDFISFHISGGTTEIVLCRKKNGRINCKLIGGTDDLNIGQAVDRTGVMMGLHFPCGAQLDKMSLDSDASFGRIPVSVKGFSCSISGLENKTKKMYADGVKSENIAAFLFEYIATVISKLTENLKNEYDLPIIYAGGVMSNTRIRRTLTAHDNVYFASRELSSDNACGTGLLAYYKYETENV